MISLISTPMQHADGVPWWETPIPRRWHRCKPRTTGWAGFSYVERCSCGALRYGEGRPWLDRNSRRKF